MRCSCHIGSTILAAVVLLSQLVTIAFADGSYRAPATYPEVPSIPVQRAMIVYRDGQETLTVSSSYQTQSPDVAWILPLPSKPTRLESGDEGFMETLSVVLQPQIVRGDDWPGIFAGLFIFVGVFAIVARLLLERAVSLSEVAWVLVMFGSIAFVALPKFPSGSEVSSPTAITFLLDSQRVGDYDTSTISTTNVSGLDGFLLNNKLQPLTAAERPIFQDYVARGWCFVVARLHSTAAGVKTPHPIVATFDTPVPVFPMRSTALAHSKTHVDLFVISDQIRSAVGFETICAVGLSEHTSLGSKYERPLTSYYGGDYSISHPDAPQILWDHCAISRLSADLSPSQMDRDIELTSSKEDRQIIKKVVTDKTKRDYILDPLLCATGLVLMLYSAGNLDETWARNKLAQIGLGIFFIGGAISLCVFIFTPSSRGLTIKQIREARSEQEEAIIQAIRKGTLDASIAESPQRLPSILKTPNAITGQPLAIRRSPGNCAIVQQNGQVFLCTYDLSGQETRFPLP